MKKITISFALYAIVGSSGGAQAALMDRGGGLLYDSDLNVTWLQDANYAAGSTYDGIDGAFDGRMRWVNAIAWAENLSYYDSVRNVTYDDWRMPTSGPVNGISLNYSGSYDGSTDYGHNISAPGSAYAGSKGSEMAYLFYNELDNKGYCPLNTNHLCSPAPQLGWGLVNTGPFINLQNGIYWSGTQYAQDPSAAHFFAFGSDSQAGIWDSDVGGQFVFSKDARIHALAVRDGDVTGVLVPSITAIPTPSTMWLLASGLLGLLGVAQLKHHESFSFS